MIINEQMAAEEPQPGMPLALATDDALVRKALLIMQQSIDAPLSIGRVIAQLGVSRRKLERHFHDALGMTLSRSRPPDPGRAGEAPAADDQAAGHSDRRRHRLLRPPPPDPRVPRRRGDDAGSIPEGQAQHLITPAIGRAPHSGTSEWPAKEPPGEKTPAGDGVSVAPRLTVPSTAQRAIEGLRWRGTGREARK